MGLSASGEDRVAPELGDEHFVGRQFVFSLFLWRNHRGEAEKGNLPRLW